MYIKLNIPNYDGNAVDVIWDKGANFTATTDGVNIIIKANKSGLMSLAKQMIYMAYNDLPSGSHIHYDDFLLPNIGDEYCLVIEKE